MSALAIEMRKRAEIRAKIDRGDGKVDRISAQLLQAAGEIERLQREQGLALKYLDEGDRSASRFVLDNAQKGNL